MNKNKKTSRFDFVMLTADLKQSPVYRVMSLTGHRILACMEIEYMRHAGTTNGELVMTHATLHDYGIHPKAIPLGLREAEGLGLIERTRQGRGGNAAYRTATMFRLTYLPTWKLNGSAHESTPATDEWRQLGTVEQAEAAARAARANSPQFQPSPRVGNRPRKISHQGRNPTAVPGSETDPEKANFPGSVSDPRSIEAFHLPAVSDAATPPVAASHAPEPVTAGDALEPVCRLAWSTPIVVEVMADGTEVALADCKPLADLTAGYGSNGQPVPMLQRRRAADMRRRMWLKRGARQ